MKVLIVDNNPSHQQQLSGLITEYGHEVIVADSGQRAFQLLRDEKIDLILMDVDMQEMDAFQTTKKIRETFFEHWVPVVFLAEKSDDAALEKGIESGGDDCIFKPVNSVILKAKLRAMGRILEMQNTLKKLNAQLEKAAVIDSLTGLTNRRGFEEYAQHQWAQASREQSSLAVLMLDIDCFKQYNDNYGHLKGDRCLQKVADIIKEAVNRPIDMVARYGGEEFIVLLPQTDMGGAYQVAEQIRSAINYRRIPHLNSWVEKHVTVSIGCSVCENVDHRSIDELINSADRALYQAKEKGRNCTETLPMPQLQKIIVVDDDLDTLRLMREILDEHWGVYTFSRGTDCVRRAAEVKPDLIILDIMMADMDGFTVVKKLRDNEETADIPIIMMSAMDRQEQIRLGEGLGISDFIQKPVDEDILISDIRTYLQ